MWQPPTMELMPGFWPPKPSRLWNVLLQPLRRHYLHRHYRISNVTLAGQEHLSAIQPGDGVLLAPNHSHDADPHVMMHVGRRLLSRQLYFMAAWQVFLAHGGIDGWVMQRFGAFSVDREGCDRRAIRQATEILTTGRWLVVFPEGEIYHTNERLTPLREGVAFMAITSQRDLDKASAGKRVWVVPTCIHYKYDQDITPWLSEAAIAMERRLMIKSRAETPVHERIVQLGDVLLTIKEKEHLGRAGEGGDLPSRLDRLIHHLLTKHETTYFGKTSDGDSVPLRVKVLRRAILEKLAAENGGASIPAAHQSALDDLHLALQLYSYPGDYVSSRPSVERMAETIEKFEEDLAGTSTPKGTRSADVTFGPPIDVRPFGAGRSRTASVELTARLEDDLRALMVTAAR